MAIGTLAAIGLGLAGAGSAVSAISQKNAANKASQVAQDTAAQNNALTREIYGQNKEIMSPFVQRGNVAGDYLNAMLGLPSSAPQALPQAPVQPSQAMPMGMAMGDFKDWSQGGIWDAPQSAGLMQTTGWNGQPNPAGMMSAAPSVTSQGAQDAFRQYIANSDYGFQFGEGANKVNSGYAGAGAIKSGAAMKALEQYRQNLQSGYRGEYMSALGNQQGVGLSGASALAGVGQNYVNTISNNNNAAGTAAANAALVKGNNSFGNVLGLLGGGLFGYGR